MKRRNLILSIIAVLLVTAACAATYAAGSGLVEMIQRHMSGL